MEMTFRWYGSQEEKIALDEIRQIPAVKGIVGTLMDIPVGEVWPRERIKELKEESQEEFLKIPLQDHMKHYMDQGHSKKEAMKLVAKDRGVGKREIYQQLLEEE